jgi:hypothetical protein
MNTSINAFVAAEHVADLRRAADRRSRSAGRFDSEPAATIELQLVDADRTQAVARLAELDDAPALTGSVLLALIDGEAVAGLSLNDQRVVANPFVPTHEVVELLRIRAAHLSGARAHRRLPRLPRLPRLRAA